MTLFFVCLNLAFLLIILLWAAYKVHVSEKIINRTSFLALVFGTSVVIIAHVVPSYSNLFYHTYAWQRLVFNGCLAYRAFADIYCEYGSEKWKEAFTNSKKRFLHITKGV